MSQFIQDSKFRLNASIIDKSEFPFSRLAALAVFTRPANRITNFFSSMTIGSIGGFHHGFLVDAIRARHQENGRKLLPWHLVLDVRTLFLWRRCRTCRPLRERNSPISRIGLLWTIACLRRPEGSKCQHNIWQSLQVCTHSVFCHLCVQPSRRFKLLYLLIQPAKANVTVRVCIPGYSNWTRWWEQTHGQCRSAKIDGKIVRRQNSVLS